jgi:hypothetical protein
VFGRDLKNVGIFGGDTGKIMLSSSRVIILKAIFQLVTHHSVANLSLSSVSCRCHFQSFKSVVSKGTYHWVRVVPLENLGHVILTSNLYKN